LVVLIDCFLSLDLIFVLYLTWLLASVLFLSLAWRYNFAIANSQVICLTSYLQYDVESPLVIISINSGSFRKLVKVALKGRTGKGVVERRKRYRACWDFGPLCVFGYISFVVVEGACVRHYRGLGLYIVGTIG
jgi:hypothetical protein